MQIRQNLQIHTIHSSCAKREMRIESIIAEALAHDLELIGFTDHLNLPEQWSIPGRVRAETPAAPPGMRILVGCEAQMTAPDEISITPEVAAECELVLISCNHYHLNSVADPADTSPAGWASHHLAMIEGAIGTGFCDIIPHPFLLEKVAKRTDADAILAAYDWDEVRRILALAAAAGVAFELNPVHVRRALAFMQRLVQEGQEVGCRFSIGADAHRLDAVGYQNFEGGRPAAGQLLEGLDLKPQSLWSPAA